jgi:uncharacterized protein YgiB involved in biofilm formation
MPRLQSWNQGQNPTQIHIPYRAVNRSATRVGYEDMRTKGGFAMLQMPNVISLRFLAVIAATLTLAGCGKSEKEANKAPLVRHAITSAVDCSENSSLSYEQCTAVIEKAVADHDTSAAKFTTQKACETAEGQGKCERVDNKAFRPKLVAFLLTLSEPPVAQPLYASNNGELGFRGADSSTYASEDDKVTFSKSAVHAAELMGTAAKEESVM